MERLLKIAFYLFIIGLFSVSCERIKDNSIRIIEIEKNINNFKPFKLSDLGCDLEYVILETSPDALLMGIAFVDISDNHIVVADRDNCLLFSRSGKFISRIGSKGRGPGENSAFTQVKIYNDKIFLPDGLSSNINIFNIKGELLSSLKSPGKFAIVQENNWMVLTDSSYLVHIHNNTGTEKYRIALININGDILQSFANTHFYNDHEVGSQVNRNATFYKHINNIFLKERLNDTIWQVKEDNLEPVYAINLGKYSYTFDYSEYRGALYIEKFHETISVRVVYETSNLICFKLDFHNQYPLAFKKIFVDPFGNEREANHQILGLYDKLNDDFFLVAPSNVNDQIEPTGIENDIDGGINFMPMYAVNETLLIGWFDSYQLKMYVASESFKNYNLKYPEKKKQLEELAADLNENDNPVLMLVKLKE